MVGDEERADEVEAESPEEYAERKRITITNPLKRRPNVANGNDMTRAELQDVVDNAIQILTDAYTPESSREDLAAAVGEALDALEGNGGDDEDSDEDDAE